MAGGEWRRGRERGRCGDGAKGKQRMGEVVGGCDGCEGEWVGGGEGSNILNILHLYSGRDHAEEYEKNVERRAKCRRHRILLIGSCVRCHFFACGHL